MNKSNDNVLPASTSNPSHLRTHSVSVRLNHEELQLLNAKKARVKAQTGFS